METNSESKFVFLTSDFILLLVILQYCFIRHILIYIICVYCWLLFYSLKEKSEREKPCALLLPEHKLTNQQKLKRIWKEFERLFLPTGPMCLHFGGSMGNSDSSQL